MSETRELTDTESLLAMPSTERMSWFDERMRRDYLEAVRARGQATARIDQATRQRLAQRIHRPLERDERLEGEVHGIDDKASKFVLGTSQGRVEVGFTPSQRTIVFQALEQRPLARLRVEGLLELSEPRRMQRVDHLSAVDHARAGDISKLWERLDKLADVPEGWLDGEGLSPTEAARLSAKKVLARLLADEPDIPKPSTFPTPGGGVQAEWVVGRWSAEVHFPPEADLLQCEAVHADSGATHQISVDMRDAAERGASVGQWLRSLERAWA